MSVIERASIVKLITLSLTRQLRSPISDKELHYITQQVNDLSNDVIKKYQKNEIVSNLVKIFIQDKKERNPEPTFIDTHELLRREIGKMPETLNHNLAIETPDDLKNDPNNISTIFGTNKPLKLQSIFNPKELNSRAYLVLDRRYQSGMGNNVTTFSWNISILGNGISNPNVSGTNAPLKDVVAMRMYPFTFPNTQYAITDNNRVSILIDELNNQSYAATDAARRFHFMFNALQTKPLVPNAQYILEEIGYEVPVFEFYRPIEELTTLTLSFGNPFNVLSLDPDTLPASISASGIQTLLTFSQTPLLAIGDVIFITGFTTTNTAADAMQIEQINDVFGWAVVSIPTSTQVLVNVDLSGLTGVIINNPYKVYLDSKRFTIQLEFTFRRFTE